MADVCFRYSPLASAGAEIARIMHSPGFFAQVADEVDCALESFRDALGGGKTRCVFAQNAVGEILGFAMYSKIPCSDKNWQLHWLCVANSARGGGIGALLVREVLRLVGGFGARTLFLQTDGRAQYLPTRKFYEKLGFKLAAVLKDYYVVGDDCFYYAYDL